MIFSELGNTCVVGLQWGDEGKGKFVDLLTEHFDVVVRYAGGANAGHTVRIGEERFALHLMPSGILRPGVLNLVGPAVALDPEVLVQEIQGLREREITVADNLKISRNAHLVMPYHRLQDRLAEARLAPGRKIGTTAKGIGPCYADKMLRGSAFRLADLARPDEFRSRLAEVVDDRSRVFRALYDHDEAMDAGDMADAMLASFQTLESHLADTTHTLHEVLARGDRVLFEGAQGSLLDLNHGTFPFVTSSTCTAAGAAAAAGVPSSSIQSTIGVMKAYTTRVGGGPFPTELPGETGDRIRTLGHEYGTTTGRPRRCGWFDAVAVRYAVRLSGVTQLAITHLDTLGSLEEIGICTGYRHRGKTLPHFPTDAAVLSEVEPILEMMPGWGGAKLNPDEPLPQAARQYTERLESLLGVPITLVSTGPERHAVLVRAPVSAFEERMAAGRTGVVQPDSGYNPGTTRAL